MIGRDRFHTLFTYLSIYTSSDFSFSGSRIDLGINIFIIAFNYNLQVSSSSE